MSEEPRQNLGRGLVDRKLVEAPPPSNLIAGRPKAALLFLFWVFGDFRCGVPLFISLFLLYINIKTSKNRR